MNRMADVAKMFGKDINERFTVKWGGRRYDMIFSLYGITIYYDFIDFEDAIEAMLLRALITGEAVIIDNEAPGNKR